MKKIYFILFFGVLFASSGFSQVTGIKNIPTDYATLAAAITALNTAGVGAGGATINVPAGYTENAPTGGFLLGSATLNASLSAVNTLVFQKSGSGTNPLITAPVGTTTTLDGIFTLQGVDYTTINGIDLQENPLNTTTPGTMEWGYGFVNRIVSDGCQNNLVQNCTITLQKIVLAPQSGIYMAHHTAASVTGLTINTATGLNSNNKFYTNTILSCPFIPINITGFAAASPYTYYDQGNDIGGTSLAQGNNIVNYGGLAGGSFYITNYGVYASSQNNANISYNTITQAADGLGGVGMYTWGVNSTFTCNNNDVTINGLSYSPTPSNHMGIWSNATGSNLTANNNTLNVTILGSYIGSVPVYGLLFPGTGNFTATGNNVTVNQSVNQTFYGIYSGAAGTANISSNTISNSSTSGTNSSTNAGIYNSATVASGITINNNNFYNWDISSTGDSYLIYNNSNTQNNTVTNNTVTGAYTRSAASGTMYGYYNFGSPTGGTANISNNNFSSITLSGSSIFYGIYQATSTTQTEIVNNNTISNVTGGTGIKNGIYHSYGANGSSASGNTISDISSTGAGGAITGIAIGVSAGSLGGNFSGNTIYGLSNTGTTVTGISQTAGLNSTISKNKIYDLTADNSGGAAYGLTIAGLTTSVNVYNNLIGDLKAPSTSSATDGVRGINLTATTAGTDFYIYYNTIYLNATSSGANFWSSGIYHTTSATATSGRLNLNNNIIVNKSVPNGTGRTVALRRSAVSLANFRNTSNRNLFYAGTPSATRWIYYDGTTSYQTLALYVAAVTPRDLNSVTEDPPFISTTGASTDFLHLDPAGGSQADGGALPAGGITVDYDGDTRHVTTPDIGADEYVAGPAIVRVTVTATAGTLTADYATVKLAFDAINAGTHQGTINVIIKANTTETATAVLNRSNGSAPNYTSVNMYPNSDGLVVLGNINGAIIKLNNAANVTIDGDNPNTGGTNRNLSITNTNTSTPYGVWIGGSSGTPATNNTVKNCIVINGTKGINTFAVFAASTTDPYTSGYFNNITIQNNNVQKSYTGIAVNAASVSGNGSGTVITQNLVNTSGANSIASACIYTQGVDGATVSNNTVGNMVYAGGDQNYTGIWIAVGTLNSVFSGNTISTMSGSNVSPRGIAVTTDVSNSNIDIIGNTITGLTTSSIYNSSGIWVFFNTHGVTIRNNKISNIKNSNLYGANGILLGGTPTTVNNVSLYNNFIWDIAAFGWSGTTEDDNGYGIAITGGGGYKLYHNTVRMNTNQTYSTSIPAALLVTSGVATANTLDIRDNLFINTQAVGAQRYCVYSSATSAVYQDIDYNDYYYGTAPNLGFIGSNRANIAAWRTGTGKDVNSINVAPAFTSTTDLHLVLGANDLLKAGIAITGITTDIDGDLRNLGLPTMGADETYLANLWAGNTSSNWGLASSNTNNWDNGSVPASGANISVPFGVPNMPVLDANRTIGNLTFLRGGSSTVSLNDKTLTINGAITGLGTLTGTASAGVSTSNLILTGAAGTLNFTPNASNAADHSLNNLTLNAAATATLGDSLSVYGTVSLGAAATLNLNNKNLTLKSNTNNTARVADLTLATLSNATNVTVERWVPLTNPGPGTGRRYQLLTPTVTTATTIRQNWMENGLVASLGGVSNPVPGYGTHITGSGGNTNGFDHTQTDQPSLFTTANAITPTYNAFTSTTTGAGATMNALTGYFLFVRGDRSTNLTLFNTNQAAYGWVNLPSSNTTLRATGTIQQGTKTNVQFNAANPGNPIIGGAGVQNLITNPYPSAIDWDALRIASGGPGGIISNSYTYWDPHYGTRGGFVSVNAAGTQTPAPPTPNTNARYIQSGQAFYVTALTAAAPAIVMNEIQKSPINNNTVFLIPPENFSASLFYYEGDGTRRLADGVRTIYDNNYSTGIDAEDVYEIANWDENMAIPRNGNNWVVESRPVITTKDTMPLLINSLKVANYELEFRGESFSNPGLVAKLIDNFTGVPTILSVTGTTVVPISVTPDPASSATNRFMVVFGNPGGPLPIDLSSVKAYEKNAGIQVDWVMNTEQDMDKYEVEKSADGRNFVKATTVLSRGNSSVQVNYGWFDANPVFGDNFYRIKSIDKGGQYKHSNIVRVNLGKGAGTGISMYPNPFEGTGFNLQMDKVPAGKYSLTMYNNLGQRVHSGTVTHSGGSATQYIELGKDLAAGTYTVKISGGGTELTRTITKK